MKKLSILLAVILTGNIFAATTLAKEPTVSNATIAEFDFNDGTGTELDARLKPSDAYKCAGYEKIDDAHGSSIKMDTNSKIRYDFGASVDGEVTISFDMYAKGALSTFWVTSTDAAESAGNAACYIYADTNNFRLNYWGWRHDLAKYDIGKWHTIKLVITDIRGTNPTVTYYIDSEKKDPRSLNGNTNGYITFGGGGAAGSEVLLDNIMISGKQISFSEDFNNLTARTDETYLGLDAKVNLLTPAWKSINNWYNKCSEIDAEHGKSLGAGGTAGFYYELPVSLTEDATLSFDLFIESTADDGYFFIKGAKPGNTAWDGEDLAILQGSKLKLGSSWTEYTVEAKRWYRIDMKFDIGDTCKVDYYVNGTRVCTAANKYIPTNITFKAHNRANDKFTYIDNVTFNTSAAWFSVTGAKVLDGENTIDKAADWNKERDYTISVNAINTTGTSQNVYAVVAGYNSDNRFINCKTVPITIPSSMTSSVTGTANLGAVNMTGATKIKIFAFNNYTSLSPVTIDAVELN